MLQTWYGLTITAQSAALCVATVVIVCQRRRLNHARHDADHDTTTGLPNRRAVTAYLRAALRHGRPTGVVLLDLDRFKRINDTYDHETGNDLLVEIGRRLATITAPAAFAARLSGDEFVVLVDGGHDHTAAVADAAFHVVADTPVRLGLDDVWVSASVGYANATLGICVRELLRAADTAMYHAKKYGRATVYGMPASTQQSGVGRGPRYRDRRVETPDAQHPPHPKPQPPV